MNDLTKMGKVAFRRSQRPTEEDIASKAQKTRSQKLKKALHSLWFLTGMLAGIITLFVVNAVVAGQLFQPFSFIKTVFAAITAFIGWQALFERLENSTVLLKFVLGFVTGFGAEILITH